MDSLTSILARVKDHQPPPNPNVDEDFDDEDFSSSSDDEADDKPCRELDVLDTLAAIRLRMTSKGMSSKAFEYVDFVVSHCGPRPKWCLLEAGSEAHTRCDVFPSTRTAKYSLEVKVPGTAVQLDVCEDAFPFLVAATYYASFRDQGADVYTCGKTADEVQRNYELTKRCLLQM